MHELEAKMPPREWLVWEALVAARGKTVSFEELAEVLDWPEADASLRQNVRVLTSRINARHEVKLVMNISNRGYRLTPEALKMLGMDGPCPSCGRLDTSKVLLEAADSLSKMERLMRAMAQGI